jgi:hypothetical protein
MSVSSLDSGFSDIVVVRGGLREPGPRTILLLHSFKEEKHG